VPTHPHLPPGHAVCDKFVRPMTKPPLAPTRSRRRVLTVVLVLSLLAVACAIAWFTVRSRGAERRRVEIARIQAANEPLVPADIPWTPPASGKDPSEWLMQSATVRNGWDMADLADPGKYTSLLDRARGRAFGEDARVAFERFEAAIRPIVSENADPGGTWAAYWVVLANRIAECNGARDWDERERTGVDLLAVGLEPSAKLARMARDVHAIDPHRVASLLDSADAAFPRLPLVEEAGLADAINVAAISDALAKRPVDALDRVRDGLAMARVHAPAHFGLAHTVWAHHMTRVLDTLQTVLSMVPRGLDVTDIEAALTAASPREELQRALRGERAFGNRVFESLRDGWRPTDAPTLGGDSFFARWRHTLVADGDQAEYLRVMSSHVEAAGKPAFKRGAVTDPPANGFWTPNASRMTIQVRGPLATTDRLEARLVIARIALTAYRAGAKDALLFLSKSSDPYDGQPIRCALGEKGLVVIWSVGPDGRDDDGRADSDDVVWALRLAE